MQTRATSLENLTEEFDALLESMQSSKSKRGMANAFAASPGKLGRAAVHAVGAGKPRRATGKVAGKR
jgi:antitoxin Phd